MFEAEAAAALTPTTKYCRIQLLCSEPMAPLGWSGYLLIQMISPRPLVRMGQS
ncbi:hypothetical protein PGTUg99_032288 [Puccinia graminis f. sp. tritici]|uniref:Uncharacterized protein n=1 Tax=Puccinia graminis f. sp. tritici TaxID=56615 RepID=A0A5B0RNP5_PUCGR|nr:hypothetical protein PGTUg99_032288 [Puccinia graminis f. sp. tritici]